MITVGTKLGRYEIRSKIGEGGMGEVYLALDTELDRTIAIKILPESLASDQQRLQRFIQEAKAASALNHPHILTIYEIGTAGATRFIATEFIDGDTLRGRIRAGMRLPEILDIAIQAASALAAAHAAGIIHRDIKPENIMVRRDGIVKVLDFGLAKLMAHETPNVDTEAPTRFKTDPGTVVGTAIYMSPEQARGMTVDERTDIFSLGVVLYEMVAGHLPFEGSTSSEVLASILSDKDPQPLARYSREAPTELERIVSKALRKNRDERYQTIKDLAIDLKSLKQELEFDRKLERSAGPTPMVSDARSTNDTLGRPASSAEYLLTEIKRHKKGVVLASVAFVLVLAAVGFGLYKLIGGRSKSPATKAVPLTSFRGHKYEPAFSPDGKQVAFVWDGEKGDNLDIYVKLIGEDTPLRLTTNPAPDRSPTWSPDGRFIAFIRVSDDGKSLMTIPALGGPERTLTTFKGDQSVTWSPDGKQLAIASRDSPGELTNIALVSAETGDKQKLSSAPATQFNGDRGPQFSPDGQTVAFIRSTNVAIDDIYLVAVSGGEPRRVTNDNQRIEGLDWTADGHEIVFSSTRGGSSYALWRVSVSGGPPQPLPGVGENAYVPVVSRHGNYLAYIYRRQDINIWRAAGPNSPIKDSSPTALIASTRSDLSPSYSPEGKRIAFASDRSGSMEIWICDSEGLNPVEVTHFGRGHNGTPRWSPDGRQIAFDARVAGSSDIYVVGADGGSPRQLTTEPSAEIMPVWSKDGRWIFFGSDRSGDWQIWKIAPEGGAAIQVTKGGGYGTVGATDGFIYYTRNSGTDAAKKAREPGVWRVPVDGGEELRLFDQGRALHLCATADGIYFYDARATTGPALEFYSFDSKQTTKLLAVDKLKYYGLITASPDGKWLLYAQIDQEDNDIMLVENFQ